MGKQVGSRVRMQFARLHHKTDNALVNRDITSSINDPQTTKYNIPRLVANFQEFITMNFEGTATGSTVHQVSINMEAPTDILDFLHKGNIFEFSQSNQRFRSPLRGKDY
jgi:hypothetical protein